MTFKLWATILSVFIVVCTSKPALGNPVQRIDAVDIHLEKLVQNTTELSNGTVIFNRQRQVVGDDVGENVVQIISGVLGGGLGNIFQGSTAFVGDTAVAGELQTVFQNLAPPLDVVLNYGFDGLKQYFGIGQTTLKPKLNATQAPVMQVQVPQNVGQGRAPGSGGVAAVQPQQVQQQQQQVLQQQQFPQVQQQQQQYVPVQQQQAPVYAPVAVQPPTPVTEDNDNDNEDEDSRVKIKIVKV